MCTHILKEQRVIDPHLLWAVFLLSHFLRKGLTKWLSLNQRQFGCIDNTFWDELSDPKLWPGMASNGNCDG